MCYEYNLIVETMRNNLNIRIKRNKMDLNNPIKIKGGQLS